MVARNFVFILKYFASQLTSGRRASNIRTAKVRTRCQLLAIPSIFLERHATSGIPYRQITMKSLAARASTLLLLGLIPAHVEKDSISREQAKTLVQAWRFFSRASVEPFRRKQAGYCQPSLF